MSGPTVESALYLVEGARLAGPVPADQNSQARPAKNRVTRVVIRPREGWQPLPEPWSASAPSGEQLVTFEVPADDCDRLLQAVLERCWSVVVAVQPDESPAADSS